MTKQSDRAARDVYPGEEVGTDDAPAVGEAVLELAERGTHRVLRRPPGPVRYHVDALPQRRVPLSRTHAAVLLLLAALARGRRDAPLLG
jgi:hypothetical protein